MSATARPCSSRPPASRGVAACAGLVPDYVSAAAAVAFLDEVLVGCPRKPAGGRASRPTAMWESTHRDELSPTEFAGIDPAAAAQARARASVHVVDDRGPGGRAGGRVPRRLGAADDRADHRRRRTTASPPAPGRPPRRRGAPPARCTAWPRPIRSPAWPTARWISAARPGRRASDLALVELSTTSPGQRPLHWAPATPSCGSSPPGCAAAYGQSTWRALRGRRVRDRVRRRHRLCGHASDRTVVVRAIEAPDRSPRPRSSSRSGQAWEWRPLRPHRGPSGGSALYERSGSARTSSVGHPGIVVG